VPKKTYRNDRWEKGSQPKFDPKKRGNASKEEKEGEGATVETPRGGRSNSKEKPDF